MHEVVSQSKQFVRRVVFVGVTTIFAAALHASVVSAQQFFVANYSGNSITVYPRAANGNVLPSVTITGVSAPHEIAIRPSAQELFVANNAPYAVTVYDLGTGGLKRTIAGPSTGLNGPTGIAVDDVHGELFVANDFAGTVLVYDILASGDIAPKRTIESASLSRIVGLAIDLVNDELVVANYGGSSIVTFDRGSSGDSVPTRIIQGSATGLRIPQGIALFNDEIVVANSAFGSSDTGAILVFARTAAGDVAPTRRLEGGATQLCQPFSVALDRIADELVVANANFSGACSDSVTTFSRTAAGNTAPLRVFAGTFSGLSHPTFAAITSTSTVNVKNSPIRPSANAGASVGYVITATAKGGPVFNASLTDTLPAGLTWRLSGGPDANSCNLSSTTPPTLTCSFGDLAKNAAREVQVSATSTAASCPGITNQAIVIFNDGTTDVKASADMRNIDIKCK